MRLRPRYVLYAVGVLACWQAGCVVKPTSEQRRDDTTIDIANDGRRLAFTGSGVGGADIYVLDLRTGNVTAVTGTTAYEKHPAFAPDGHRLVYAAGKAPAGEFHIQVRNAD